MAFFELFNILSLVQFLGASYFCISSGFGQGPLSDPATGWITRNWNKLEKNYQLNPYLVNERLETKKNRLLLGSSLKSLHERLKLVLKDRGLKIDPHFQAISK